MTGASFHSAIGPAYLTQTFDRELLDRFYLLCLETPLSGPQLIRRWRRRHWIAFVFRTLKHLLATEACQAHSEDAYYGHLV